MNGDRPYFRLTEGALLEREPSTEQIWNAIREILFAQRRSTYKFAFLQAVVNVSAAREETLIRLSEIFENMTALYWQLLLKYPLGQTYRHARYVQSSVETIILQAQQELRDTAFAELPDAKKKEVCAATREAFGRTVVGASYGNSQGVLFGFSKREDTLELSPAAKCVLVERADEISHIVEIQWLTMMEKINSDTFPEPLAIRLRRLKEESGQRNTEEELPMAVDRAETAENSRGGLQQLQNYIEEAKEILRQQTEKLENAAINFEKELKTAFPGSAEEKLIFQSRVKGTESLSEKIYRKNYYNRYPVPAELIQNLPDMIGVRVVCLLNQQEERLLEQLRAAYPEQVETEGGTFYQKKGGQLLFDFRDQPQTQKNGQPIYRIACKWMDPELGPINCELQIKSMVHFFWGELEHMLFYKNYSYMISQSFYNQYMLKIENALSNVNDQMGLLYERIEENRGGSRQEIRGMASCVLYQHYHKEIEKQIDCSVDLREVFDVIVDICFQNYGNQDRNIENLSALIANIQSRKLHPELLKTIEEGRLDPRAIPVADLPLARIVDGIIRSRDVYWIFFVETYGSHLWKDEYTDYNVLLGEICRILMRMLRNGFVDSIEQLYDELEPLYQGFEDAILDGILMAFERVPKLDFFIFSTKLNTVRRISEEVVRKTQTHMTDQNVDVCTANLEVIRLYTCCRIEAELYDSVEGKRVVEMIRLLRSDDPFALAPDDGFEPEEGKSTYTKREFESIFAQGGA